MTTIYTYVAFAAWALVLVTWIGRSFAGGKAVRIPAPAKQAATTALIVLAFALLFIGKPPGILGLRLTDVSAPLGPLGAALCVAGLLVAAWARLTLGRNWSGPFASVNEGHELVRWGPYRFVRHPIYTGFLVAMLGTALTIGTVSSYLAVIVGCAAFLLRIRIEEELMASHFPDAYAEYRQRTAALIPFLW